MAEERSEGFADASVPDAYDRYLTPYLFEPWACELLARAGMREGAAVLDVASGPGCVARGAAMVVGAAGRVVASDISPAMLAVAAARSAAPGSAPIEYTECSAAAIAADDDSFDVVMCQQGLQFFPDRLAAVREMRRVARPGGVVVVSTWAAEHHLGLFGPIADVLREFGMDEPYPRAFDAASYALDAAHLHALLRDGGLREIAVETLQLDAVWPTLEDAVATILGTPFGPQVRALPAGSQGQIWAMLAERLERSSDGSVTVSTTSNVGRGVK